MIKEKMLRAGLLLALFAVLGTALTVFSYSISAERIEANRRAALLRNLTALFKPNEYNNDLLTDTAELYSRTLLGTNQAVTVYRARRDGEPVGAAFTAVAPDGYNGDINVLMGIYADGTLAGVRVVEHRETPGLGDMIELSRSDWVLGFTGKSLINPDASKWQVKRDGGVFDQFTGATVTPRAVVKAVFNGLKFFEAYRTDVFAPAK